MWRHNERHGVSNHQPHDFLLNRLFQAQIKENIKAPRHRQKIMEYLESTMETVVFDILICWKWLGTNHKQVL